MGLPYSSSLGDRVGVWPLSRLKQPGYLFVRTMASVRGAEITSRGPDQSELYNRSLTFSHSVGSIAPAASVATLFASWTLAFAVRSAARPLSSVSLLFLTPK